VCMWGVWCVGGVAKHGGRLCVRVMTLRHRNTIPTDRQTKADNVRCAGRGRGRGGRGAGRGRREQGGRSRARVPQYPRQRRG
jgi:hypothetical protein